MREKQQNELISTYSHDTHYQQKKANVPFAMVIKATVNKTTSIFAGRSQCMEHFKPRVH
jgi:hypothetical protein